MNNRVSNVSWKTYKSDWISVTTWLVILSRLDLRLLYLVVLLCHRRLDVYAEDAARIVLVDGVDGVDAAGLGTADTLVRAIYTITRVDRVENELGGGLSSQSAVLFGFVAFQELAHDGHEGELEAAADHEGDEHGEAKVAKERVKTGEASEVTRCAYTAAVVQENEVMAEVGAVGEPR